MLLILAVSSIALAVSERHGRWLTLTLILVAAVSAGVLTMVVHNKLTDVQKAALIVAATTAALLIGFLAIPGIVGALREKEILFDDFEEGFDSQKWELTSPGGIDPRALRQLYVQGGKLHLVVSPKNSADGANAIMKPILPKDVIHPNATIDKISMKLVLVSQRGGRDGAAYPIVSRRTSPILRAWVGPNDKKEPAVGYSLCNDNTCRDPKDSDYSLIEKGREYKLEAFVTTNGGVQFNLDGQRFAVSAPDRRGIRAFSLYLFSEPKRDFHVTIDDVIITY